MAKSQATSDAILDVAERLAQTRGFNGFSYADVSAKLHVTKAAIHYHFQSKADLGKALIARYQVAFSEALGAIGGERDARKKLRRYVELYDAVMRNDRMCLCGMFAAEFATLPSPMQAALRKFFDVNEAWLATVFEEGRRDREIRFEGTARERARLFLSALEGAMLVARTFKDERRFRAVAEQALRDVSSGALRSA